MPGVLYCRFVTVSLMRWLDGTLGYALATLLACFARPAPPGGPSVEPGSRILVMKFFGIGSIQLASPLIRAVRRAWPEASLVFVTFQANAGFVRLMPDVDEVWGVRTSSPWAFVRDTLGLLARFRQRPVRLVLDLEFFSKYSAVLGFLSRAPFRLGYALPVFWRRRLTSHFVAMAPQLHIVDCYLQFAGALGLATEPALVPPRVGGRAAASVLPRLPVPGPLVVVNVNAGETSLLRRWPPERFAEVAERLAGAGATLAFVGSAAERPYVQSVLGRLSPAAALRSWNGAGELSPEDLVALLAEARLVLSNDSGPLHLAASLGRPTLSLFGPETPRRYGPRGPGHRIFYEALPCSPCLSPDNGKHALCPFDQKCLRDIPSERVAREALAALGSP